MSKHDDLVKKLKEIFQIDKPELDFGIYRILNARVVEINDYLENRLKKKVQELLSKQVEGDSATKVKELTAKIRDEYGKRVFDEQGKLADETVKASDLGRQLIELQSAAPTAAEHENAVFTHLLTFFSRYYDNGDFISQRRYKGDTYAVPYAGEEVVLHWANKDQYYTKSGENFSNYAFKLDDGRSVCFRLVTADTAKDNRKDNDKERRFVLIEEHTRMLTDDEGEDYEETLLPITEENNELVLRFEYKAMPKNTKQETLVLDATNKVLAYPIVKSRWLDLSKREPTENNPQRTLLEKCLTSYTAKNSTDYFIHKDLGGFLRRELDFYIKNEVMHLDDVQNAEKFADIEKNLRLIQTLRAIALDLVTFLAQLEDFQKKLWLKKKFVVATHYCITLDRVPESLYPVIAGNPLQWEQWKNLGMLDGKVDLINQAKVGSVDYLKEYPYLMVDTTLFDNTFKQALLATLDNLDESLDGLLIHGDNFQALNLLQERYRGHVKCVYIDPPYNKGADEFIYKDHYQHSSWLSMISDRLKLAKPLMSLSSTFAASIDIKEIDKLTAIFDDLLGESSKKNSITIKRGSATGAKVINPGVVNISENVLLYSSNDTFWEPNRVFRRKEYDNRYGSLIVNIEEESCEKWIFKSVLDAFAELLNIQKSKLKKTLGESYNDELEKFVIKNSDRIVRMASLDDNSISIQAKEIKALSLQVPGKIFHLKRDNANDYYILNGGVLLFYKHRLIKIGDQWVPGEPITDIWDDVLPNDLHNEGGVTLLKGKKPEKLICRVLDIGSCENELVLDFFVGSGTSAAVAQKMKRRWIGIEQGEYFDTTTKTRLLKTLNGERSGITNTVGWLGGGAFKVLKLESYEDTLNNLQLRRTKPQQDLLDMLPEAAQEDYLLRYLLDIESRGSLLSVEQFNKPFDCKLKVTVDSAGAYEERTIDLVETFSYLIGLRVKHIDMQLAKGFVAVTGWLPTGEKTLVLWRDVEQVDYEALNRLCDKLAINPADSEFEIVYINGDHNIPAVFTSTEAEGGITKTLKIRQIEPEFLSRMFAVDGV